MKRKKNAFNMDSRQGGDTEQRTMDTKPIALKGCSSADNPANDIRCCKPSRLTHSVLVRAGGKRGGGRKRGGKPDKQFSGHLARSKKSIMPLATHILD